MKSLLWAALGIAILVAIYQLTGADRLFSAEPSLFAASAAAFLASVLVWSLAWSRLMRGKARELARINIKSLAGFFAPFGLGTDLLRAHFSAKKGLSSEKALAASFMVKFYKFLLMFALLVAAIFLLATKMDISDYLYAFYPMIFFTMLGAVLVLAMRVKPVVDFFYRLLGKAYLYGFHRELNRQFVETGWNGIAVVLALLAVSSLLEIAAAYLAFLSLGMYLPLPHIFIFAAVANSLALVTFTPSGLGFVEGGGYFVLSLGYFSQPPALIGSYLILWNVIRVWIPSTAGLLLAAAESRQKNG